VAKITLHSPSFALITLEGEYDLSRRDELRSQLDAATLRDVALLDMRHVTLIDAAGLGELIKLRERMADPAVIRVIGASRSIRTLFHNTGLDLRFEMHDSFSDTLPGH
jgi:anti-anti-sigma factor